MLPPVLHRLIQSTQSDRACRWFLVSLNIAKYFTLWTILSLDRSVQLLLFWTFILSLHPYRIPKYRCTPCACIFRPKEPSVDLTNSRPTGQTPSVKRFLEEALEKVSLTRSESGNSTNAKTPDEQQIVPSLRFSHSVGRQDGSHTCQTLEVPSGLSGHGIDDS